MKQRLKIKQYKQMTYGVLVVYITNCSLSKFQDILLKKYNVEYNRQGDLNLEGLTLHVEAANMIFIWLNDYKSVSTFSHEALHATNMIFNSRGVRVDVTYDDEPQCYLLGELIKELYEN